MLKTSRKLIPIVVFCLPGLGFAQKVGKYNPYTPEPLPESAPEWMRAIAADPAGVNFFQMDSIHSSWMAMNVDARIKTREFKPAVNFYKRWRKAYEPFVDENGNIVLPSIEEYKERVKRGNRQAVQRIRNSKSQNIWRNIGPNTTVDPGNKPADSQACIYRITVSPQDPSVLYCGAEGGVVFKTTDKGENWQACNGSHNFGGPIYALAVDPNNKDIVYAGGGNFLWKTTDGGNTWTQLDAIKTRVNSIRINPDDSKKLTIVSAYDAYTDTDGGFYYSEDGGENWTESVKGIGYDHELKPGNPETIYALLRPVDSDTTFFYTSTDGGKSFSKKSLLNIRINAGRLAVSDAPGGSEYVYALVTEDAGYSNQGGVGKPHILQSKDGGNSWTDKTSRKSSNAWDGQNSFFDIDERNGGQGFFDMTLGVSNKDPETVIFGLCSAYRSTEGGSGGWHPFYGNTGIGGYVKKEFMHPDIQDIAVMGEDTWITTDGGIKYSKDFFETEGTDRMKGVYAADYHGFDMAWNDDIMAGGRWHNGNAVHHSAYGEGNTLHLYGVEYPTGHVMMSDPHRIYFSDAGSFTIPDQINGHVSESYNEFFTTKKPYETLRASGRIVPDPRYALRIIMNGRDASDNWGVGDIFQMYESEDEGRSFRSILDADGERISNYEFSRSNPDVIYVNGYYDIYKSTDNGQSWEKTQRPFENDGLSNQSPNILAVDPNDENTVWITRTLAKGGVKFTKDGGKTWNEALTDKLKNEAFYWIILTGDEVNGIYLGTTYGAKVYYKDDTMEEWMDYSTGLNPGARLTRLVPFYKEGKLRAATDQGIWEIPLVRQDFQPVAQPIALNLANGNLTHDPGKIVQLDSYSITKQEEGTQWEWDITPTPQSISNKNVRNPKVVFGRPGNYDISLTITTPSGKTHTRTIRNMITIAGATGVDEEQLKEKRVSVASNIVTVGNPVEVYMENMEQEEKIFTLHNTSGHLIKKYKMGKGERHLQVTTDGLSQGLYLYELKTPTYKTFGKIILK